MGFFEDHGSDGTIRKFRLYYIALATSVYWTDHTDFDIETVGGVSGTHRWLSKSITPGPVNNQPDGAAASFRIPDPDSSLFVTLAAENGGELALAAIYEAGFLATNKTPVPDEVLEIFSGRVDRSRVLTDDEEAIEFVLMPPVQQDAGELPTRLVSTLVRDS